MLDSERINTARILDSSHITDSYLLALALSHKGQLATFDRRIPTESVIEGAKALHVIH